VHEESHSMEGSVHEEEASINRIVDLNEDVIRRIFENFDLQPGSQTVVQTRKDLLSAAKACRAFSEPALGCALACGTFSVATLVTFAFSRSSQRSIFCG